MSDTKPQIQESQRIPSSMNTKNITTTHTKLQKNKDKVLKQARGKKTPYL